MMRIGILTFHRSINYGAFMQSYALFHTLRKRYPQHIIEVVDFEFLKKHNNYKKSLYKFPWCFEYCILYKRFQSNLSSLSLSKQQFITDNPDRLCDYIKSNYDIIIVGSDAVWAFQKMPLDNPYWLFGKKLNSVVKMSYAASSFSTCFDTVTNDEKDFISERLSDFAYIGVRDAATKAFVDSLCINKEVFLNNDPTFFLGPAKDKRLYKKCLYKNLVFGNKEKIAFMTREMPYMIEIRNKLCDHYDLLHFYRRNSNREDVTDFRCRFIPNLSPLEWYNFYAFMKLNITFYFHGACMSLINHVPTIVIDDARTPYVSKYSQLMNDLGLSSSLFYLDNLNLESLNNRIDYLLSHQEQEKERISMAINKEKEKSLSFFKMLDGML